MSFLILFSCDILIEGQNKHYNITWHFHTWVKSRTRMLTNLRKHEVSLINYARRKHKKHSLNLLLIACIYDDF